MQNPALTEYRRFIEEVDAAARRLTEIHAAELSCRKGCSGCCTDLTVLPLEYYALKEGLPRFRHEISLSSETSCRFLSHGECSIYPLRPLICRTHGLPLLYLVEEYNEQGNEIEPDDPEWQLSFCEMNFHGIPEEREQEYFTVEMVLNMESLNRRLARLNSRFLATPEGAPFRGCGRTALSSALGDPARSASEDYRPSQNP